MTHYGSDVSVLCDSFADFVYAIFWSLLEVPVRMEMIGGKQISNLHSILN